MNIKFLEIYHLFILSLRASYIDKHLIFFQLFVQKFELHEIYLKLFLLELYKYI